MHQIDIPIDYHVWVTMLDSSQRYTPKLTNSAKLKSCVIDDMELFTAKDYYMK